MAEFSNEELLRGILNNSNAVLRFIYKSYYHEISAFVNRNSGTSYEAGEIFQEGIIVIYRKLKEEKLVLNNCSFKTYLYSVCRLLWLKQLEKRKKNVLKIEDTDQYSDKLYDDSLDELIHKNERYKLFQDHFQRLGKDCQQILQLFFEKVSLREITEILGLSSENYAKKRKHQCKELLVNSIKQDSEFKNLTAYEV